MEQKFNNLKIAVCDDSIIDRDITKTFINEYLDEKSIVASIDEFSNAETLLTCPYSYDLAFLDIFLPHMNGIDLARELKKMNSNTIVIFCSASRNFIEESYSLEAFRYFIKPLTEAKIRVAMDKFLETFTSLQSISFKIGRDNDTFFLSEILYIESCGHKAIVHYDQEIVEVSEGFNVICNKLFSKFVKISRYALVNPNHVKSIENNSLIMSNGDEMNVSRDKKIQIREEIKEKRKTSY